MMRVIIIFAFGVSLGYWVGFRDAKVNKQDVVARVVGRVGGHTRNDVRADVDQEMSKVEQEHDR